jgi:hypothetical protein
MTEAEIKQQIADIRAVTKTAASSKEAAAAFLKSAGIPSTPKKSTDSRSDKKH